MAAVTDPTKKLGMPPMSEQCRRRRVPAFHVENLSTLERTNATSSTTCTTCTTSTIG
jgi:hypothetical protein